MNTVKLQDIKLTHESLAFLYTNNEKTEREIKETIPFTIATERIKYLGVHHYTFRNYIMSMSFYFCEIRV